MEPDFQSASNYNVRQERFRQKTIPFSDEKAVRYAALAVPTGCLPGFNDQVHMTEDNELRIQVFDQLNDKGFFVDDFVAFCASWLRSLPKDSYRKDAVVCMMASLLLLDKRAVNTHGYADSTVEKNSPPAASNIPSKDEWDRIWERLQ